MMWTRGRRGVSSAANGVNARQALANLLCEGGDSRLHLSHGRNKYHCPPEPVGDGNIGPFLRSSCTCSPPSALGFSHALEKWHQLQGACVDSTSTAFQSAFGHQMQSVRRRVAEAFDLPEGTAVVLAASGTDAEYVPLAIARELQHLVETDASPGAIHSVLVAAEEVGGGCKEACAGEHFDAFAPFVEDTVTKGQRLAGFEDVVMHSVPARR